MCLRDTCTKWKNFALVPVRPVQALRLWVRRAIRRAFLASEGFCQNENSPPVVNPACRLLLLVTPIIHRLAKVHKLNKMGQISSTSYSEKTKCSFLNFLYQINPPFCQSKVENAVVFFFSQLLNAAPMLALFYSLDAKAPLPCLVLLYLHLKTCESLHLREFL